MTEQDQMNHVAARNLSQQFQVNVATDQVNQFTKALNSFMASRVVSAFREGVERGFALAPRGQVCSVEWADHE